MEEGSLGMERDLQEQSIHYDVLALGVHISALKNCSGSYPHLQRRKMRLRERHKVPMATQLIREVKVVTSKS